MCRILCKDNCEQIGMHRLLIHIEYIAQNNIHISLYIEWYAQNNVHIVQRIVKQLSQLGAILRFSLSLVTSLAPHFMQCKMSDHIINVMSPDLQPIRMVCNLPQLLCTPIKDYQETISAGQPMRVEQAVYFLSISPKQTSTFYKISCVDQ